MARVSRKNRMDNVARLPFVTRLKEKNLSCDGIKWNTVAIKDIFMHGPGHNTPPRGIQPRSKCKNSAKWRYRPLKPRQDGWSTNAEAGQFCFIHLLVNCHDREPQRWEKWFIKHGWIDETGAKVEYPFKPVIPGPG